MMTSAVFDASIYAAGHKGMTAQFWLNKTLFGGIMPLLDTGNYDTGQLPWNFLNSN
jgi:hypothetical protein